MVLKVNHKDLNALISEYYDKKVALFTYGAFGIGKSFVVRQSAKDIAKEKKRKFVEWNDLSREDKINVSENPQDYFVFIDIRLSEYDAGDLKLPNFKEESETFEWKIPLWAKLLTKQESDGILFFDEMNLASPLVISSVYKIIYDRFMDEHKITDNWFIMGAGNREEDMAFTHTLPAPIRDRCGEVELTAPSVDNWTDWAIENQIDGRIVGYVNASPSSLYRVDFNDNQKFTTNRGFERLNTLIKGVTDKKKLELLSCSAIGEGIAREFLAFCKIQEKWQIEDMIKNPNKIKELGEDEIDVKYFVVSAIAERYKDEKVDFDKILEISKVLDEIKNQELVALMWRMCYAYNTERFHDEFIKVGMEDLDKEDNIINKYKKYLT